LRFLWKSFLFCGFFVVPHITYAQKFVILDRLRWCYWQLLRVPLLGVLSTFGVVVVWHAIAFLIS